MAKQTRQQRRARRAEQQSGGGDAKMVQRARARQAQVRPAAQAPKSQGGQRRAPGGGARRFVGESWGELKKVEWPNQAQVIHPTPPPPPPPPLVGVFLYANDLIWKRVIQNVFLGQ